VVAVKKLFLILLISYAATASEFIVVDSTSSHTVVLHENLGPEILVDSVTICAISGGVIYVTRNKRFFGAFPTAFYAVEVR
jgi:hypothetical protein